MKIRIKSTEFAIAVFAGKHRRGIFQKCEMMFPCKKHGSLICRKENHRKHFCDAIFENHNSKL